MHKVKKGDVIGYVEQACDVPATAPEKIWHLVQISDGLDNVTVEFLKRQRIELYRPLMRIMKPVPRDRLSHSQRKSAFKPMREKIEPFFPGYAFIDYSGAGERWREIFKMAHIRGLVCANHLPVRIAWADIQQILDKEVDGAVPAETTLAQFTFLIGENVRVTDGPFAMFNGTIAELPKWADGAEIGKTPIGKLDESDRAKLLLDIFGRETLVELSLDQIEKL